MYWLLVELVMSLKSSHKEPVRKLLLYEDYNGITIPTSNQIPDIHIAFSFVYDTFKKFFFMHVFQYCLLLHFNCDMELRVLLLKMKD